MSWLETLEQTLTHQNNMERYQRLARQHADYAAFVHPNSLLRLLLKVCLKSSANITANALLSIWFIELFSELEFVPVRAKRVGKLSKEPTLLPEDVASGSFYCRVGYLLVAADERDWLLFNNLLELLDNLKIHPIVAHNEDFSRFTFVWGSVNLFELQTAIMCEASKLPVDFFVLLAKFEKRFSVLPLPKIANPNYWPSLQTKVLKPSFARWLSSSVNADQYIDRWTSVWRLITNYHNIHVNLNIEPTSFAAKAQHHLLKLLLETNDALVRGVYLKLAKELSFHGAFFYGHELKATFVERGFMT